MLYAICHVKLQFRAYKTLEILNKITSRKHVKRKHKTRAFQSSDLQEVLRTFFPPSIFFGINVTK